MNAVQDRSGEVCELVHVGWLNHADEVIDVEEIAREAGSLADVYLMPTGTATWEFSRQMVEGTQLMTVYKPVERLAREAAERTIRMIQGEKGE